MSDERKVQWTPIMEMGAIIITILGVILGAVIPLYLHSDTKMERIQESIRSEIRDFHDRLIEVSKSKTG